MAFRRDEQNPYAELGKSVKTTAAQIMAGTETRQHLLGTKRVVLGANNGSQVTVSPSLIKMDVLSKYTIYNIMTIW